ncbi:MAG: hypothetical protein N3D10_03150 [Candidatus Micrarchaeota archaeon]|nr:hypothetical protein [Candidatus Micrarchaeota archaeon]
MEKLKFIFLILAALVFLSGCTLLEEQKQTTPKQSEIKEKEEQMEQKIEQELLNFSEEEKTQKELIEQQQKLEPKKPTQNIVQEEEKVVVEQIPIPPLEQKNALKIYVLKVGEKMNIDTWALELKDIYMSNQEFYATYLIYYENKKIKEFEVGRTNATKIRFDNGKEYIIRVVFPLDGKPNALQTQVYSTKALIRSTKNIEVSENKESYILKGYFPIPQTEKAGKISIGQKIGIKEFSVYLYGIDSQAESPKAEIAIMDDEEKEVREIKLGNGQMVEIKLQDKRKYAVVINSIEPENSQIEIEIKKILSFTPS